MTTPSWLEYLGLLAKQLDGVPTELRAVFVAKLRALADYHESGGRDSNSPPLAGVEAWQLGRARDRADLINHPSHYTAGGVEAIAVIEAWQLGFALGNALKYIARAGRKGDRLEDLRKARWYLEREIANEEAKRDVKP